MENQEISFKFLFVEPIVEYSNNNNDENEDE
jgi:hypothetical protein